MIVLILQTGIATFPRNKGEVKCSVRVLVKCIYYDQKVTYPVKGQDFNWLVFLNSDQLNELASEEVWS